jgi:hypothetical protein
MKTADAVIIDGGMIGVSAMASIRPPVNPLPFRLDRFGSGVTSLAGFMSSCLGSARQPIGSGAADQ